MINADVFLGKKVGVFGLGKAGEASVASLLGGGAEVFAWDDKKCDDKKNDKQENKPSIYCHYKNWPWESLSALVLAPGVAKNHDCAEMANLHNIPIIGDIEILYRSCPNAKYIAITGTNGKSTTTTLIGHILQEAGLKPEIGGNLGVAALALNNSDLYVLELSSYQLDLLHTTRFNIAIILNITPDHLERHGDMAGYIEAKKNIFKRQQKGDFAIIAVDDEYTKEIASCDLLKNNAAEIIAVSASQKLEKGVYVQNGILYDAISDNISSYDINNITSLTGQHNWQNAAAAYAAARAQGVASEVIIAAMRSFAGLRHRMQLVATINNVRFVNDSKATNADATQHALKAYDNIYWIAGGRAKSGGIESLSDLFPKIIRAYLIGEAENIFAETLEGKTEITRCKTLETAVKRAAADAFRENKKDAVVLLSPACASFDQFSSFEQRGDVFCLLVDELENKEVA